ncbi:MAG: hypothetical protein KVP17_003795 [Porospora cf. gigantea B]|uniref:uncharacterized protein n=1 Tax=Porospora cf. gigantea B TaxID=2853592 RepID=UPI00357188EB|nr:MAG: hypothetical protein KVP17_003795 [Porospora cf. gigantea B]
MFVWDPKNCGEGAIPLIASLFCGLNVEESDAGIRNKLRSVEGAAPVNQTQWIGFTDGKVSKLMTLNRQKACTTKLLQLLQQSAPVHKDLADTPPIGKMTLPRSILQTAISRASLQHDLPPEAVRERGFPKKVILQDIDDYNRSIYRVPVVFLGTRYTDSNGVPCKSAPLKEPGKTCKQYSPSLNSLSLLMDHFLSQFRGDDLRDKEVRAEFCAEFCDAARPVKAVPHATWEATQIQYELSNHSVLDRPLQFDKKTAQVLVPQRQPLDPLNEEALVLLGFYLGDIIDHAHRHGRAVGPIRPDMIHVDSQTGNVKVAHLGSCSKRQEDMDMDWFELASTLLRVYYNIPQERAPDLAALLLGVSISTDETIQSTEQMSQSTEQIQGVFKDVHRMYPGRCELSTLTTTLLGRLIDPKAGRTFRQAMRSVAEYSTLPSHRLYVAVMGPARPAPGIPTQCADAPTPASLTKHLTAPGSEAEATTKPTPRPRRKKATLEESVLVTPPTCLSTAAVAEQAVENPMSPVINEMVSRKESLMLTPPTRSFTAAVTVQPSQAYCSATATCNKPTPVAPPRPSAGVFSLTKSSRKMKIGDPHDVVHTRIASPGALLGAPYTSR